MVDSLNIIALISGGKDSLYSLLHCIQNGHKIVALANLYPLDARPGSTGENETDEDINSFMYQTVGHSVVPLYAEALKLPLYRRQITGSAVQTSRDYTYLPSIRPESLLITEAAPIEQDETEDLIPLLQTVLQNHPEINAINTGAIQSTYQRTRIESVALRLNLTPLAYLWQYPVLPPPSTTQHGVVEREDSTTSLLDDMAAAGCESRIIKIASGGISESLLWSDVTNARTRTQIVAGLRKFFDHDELGLRGAVVGEGGEFETIALSGPEVLWRGGRIAVDDRAVRTINGEGGVCYVQIEAARVAAHTVDIKAKAILKGEEQGQVRVPGLLDQQFEVVKRTINHCQLIPKHEISKGFPSSGPFNVQNGRKHTSVPGIQTTVSTSSMQIANITHLSRVRDHSNEKASTARAQMQLIAASIPELLSDICVDNDIRPPLTSSAIVSTMLLLGDMSDFTSINPIYATIFKEGVPIPPARVTIAAALPGGIDVMLSIILDLGPRQHRRGLHVQGRSYWAPANIGPYSQAVAVPFNAISEEEHNRRFFEIVHVAGQIPLIPASMNLFQASFAEQAVLSLQHLWRIGQERGVDCWTTGVAFLPRTQPSDSIEHKVFVAGKIWKDTNTAPAFAAIDTTPHDEEDDFDIWHLRNNRTTTDHEISPELDGQHLHQLPSRRLRLTTNPSHVPFPAFVAAEVTALPRNASVEWWSTGLTGLASAQQGQVIWKQSTECGGLILSSPRSKGTTTSFVTLLVPKTLDTGTVLGVEYMTSLIDSAFNNGEDRAHSEIVTGTAFVAAGATEAWSSFVAQKQIQDTQLPCDTHTSRVRSYLNGLAVVPCHRLWGYRAGRVDLEAEKETSLVGCEQLDVALLLRIDTQSS